MAASIEIAVAVMGIAAAKLVSSKTTREIIRSVFRRPRENDIVIRHGEDVVSIRIDNATSEAVSAALEAYLNAPQAVHDSSAEQASDE